MGLSTVAIGAAADVCVDRRGRAAAAGAVPFRARASASAANGAVRYCWRPRTRRPVSAPGTACFRSSARRSASSARPGVFLLLTAPLSDADFFAWGWRIPFLASALLVVVGLYVRLKLTETPAFLEAVESNERVRLPMFVVFREHWRMLVLGMFAALATFVLFYLMTVFALSWATSALGYARKDFLILQMIGVLFFAVSIPISAVVADRRGRRAMLLVASVAIFVFGLAFAPLFRAEGRRRRARIPRLGLFLMGLTYGPLGTALAECSRRRCATPVLRSRSISPASSARRWRHTLRPGSPASSDSSSSAITWRWQRR